GPATIPHASSGWSRRAGATIASPTARAGGSTRPRYPRTDLHFRSVLGGGGRVADVDAQSAIETHLRHGFPGQRVVVQGWRTDAMSAPHVRVLRVDPESRGGLWLHVSSGASLPAQGSAGGTNGSEFVLVTPFKTLRAVELLAMVVYF